MAAVWWMAGSTSSSVVKGTRAVKGLSSKAKMLCRGAPSSCLGTAPAVWPSCVATYGSQ